MSSEKHMENKKKVWLIVSIVLVCLVIIGGIFYYIYNKNTEDQTLTSSNIIEIDPNAQDYVASLPEDTSGSGIAIPGWGTIEIPAGQKTVSVELPNPDSNADKYYLTFQIILKNGGNEEVLYTSKMVPPGKVIQTATLSRALSKGTYDAVIRVQPYKFGSGKATNNADMETTLKVY